MSNMLSYRYKRKGEKKMMTNTDLIRREIIEAIDNVDWYRQTADKDMVIGASNEHEAWYKAEDIYHALESVLSAQPKERTEERSETHACDLISRQAAIDAVNNLTYPSSLVDVKRILVDLPSAQSEEEREYRG